MKKIIYIHQYFKTPEEGGAIRSYHIASGLIDQNIQVEMITSHNKSRYEFKIIDGIHVHYLPIRYSNSFSNTRRIQAFIRFALAAIHQIKKCEKPDRIYATSTPLTVGIIALYAKWIKKISYIFEVRDLWPEAPIQLGIIKSPFTKWISRRLEKTIYQNANKIIALSPGIRQGILKQHSKAKIFEIPNMADMDFFYEKSSKNYKKRDFVISYFGAFGQLNHLDFILDLAKHCQSANFPIRFFLVGEGAKKREIEQTATQLNLKNTQILDHNNRNGIRDLMKTTDACITSFLDVPVLETNSPNKFFDGLAAGKLSIVNIRGWLKQLIEEYRCGIFVDPGHPERFPDQIRPFMENNQLLVSYQENALKLAKEKFSKNILVAKVCELIITN